MENELIKVCKKGDFIIFLGAGSISKKARALENNMLELLSDNNSVNLI